MHKPFSALGGAFLAAVLAVGCAQTDAGLTTKVKSKLAADDTVKAYQIDVDTRDKVVTLTGTVDSSAAKDQAVTLARNTEGVASVVDNITVGAATTGAGAPDLDPDTDADEAGEAAGDAARETADKAGDAVDDAADKAGDAARRAGDKVGDAAKDATPLLTDPAITAAVKAKLLADPTVGGMKIDVDTSNGVVTLAGTAKSKAEETQALKLARETNGVKRVVDKIDMH
jgi:osmotically-inducible protein OsmY